MRKMVKEIADTKYVLLGAILSAMILFGTDFVPEFATDTYLTYTTSSWHHMIFDNGRLINGVIYYLIEKAGVLSDSSIYRLSYWSGIVFLIAALYVMAELIHNYKIDILESVLLSILLIANIFSIEYFLFLETGLFMAGIFAVIFAVRNTIGYFECQEKISYLFITAIFLIISVYIYQALLGLYVVICLPFILHYSETIKAFVKNNLIVAGEYALGMGIGLLTMKLLLNSNRSEVVDGAGTEEITLLTKLGEVFFSDKYLAFPVRASLALVLIIVVIAVLVLAVRLKRLKDLLYLMYLVIGAAVAGFLMQILGITIDFAMRIVYPSASIFGIILLHFFLEYDIEHVANRHSKNVISLAMLVFVMVQAFSFNHIFVDRYKSNQADKILCEAITYSIQKYESKTGNVVSNVCFYTDANASRSYEGIDSSRLIYKSFDKEWSDISSLNYFSGRDFQRAPANQEYADYFANNDWSNFSEEQLIFDGDTLHVCRF